MLQDFQYIQIQIAEHLRDPENNPPPDGLEPRRLAVYRRLFFNNMAGFISKAFPVLRSLYTAEDWRCLVRSFYATHASESPYFADIAKSFLRYLKEQYKKERHDPPFLTELAHYEWAETALMIDSKTIDWTQVNTGGDLFEQSPLLSPLAWRFSYHWQVHRISPDYCPQTPDAAMTHLILCRRHSGKVHFMLLNDTANALCLELKERPSLKGRQMIENVCSKFSIPKTQAMLRNGLMLLKSMQQKEIVLGTAREHHTTHAM